ncbi:nuclear transport factor 2 family protein [Saxibacter everestensis]|uniref:Nuclear transport factor 2 family protein n=1 Tax=Saxibacter everestensis TaxID=2909229 RepID=A0ABY8QZI1_9MICO|nr:nuclear transport factor 2 family protein [Brevibacteriaceae bacterium ZFBP1038]
MTASTRGVVEAHIKAFNDHDLNAMMQCFTEDALWITGRDAFSGAREIEELFSNAFSGLTPHLSVNSFISDNETLAAAELTEEIVLDGKTKTFAIAGFYRIENGKLSSAKIYREGSADA